MRPILLAITTLAACLVAAPFASGQSGAPPADSLGMSSSAIYDACIANNQGPPTECACMAGFYGGRLQEDEFRMLSIINRYVDGAGNVTDMAAVQQELRNEAGRMNMPQERFAQVMQRFATMNQDGAYGDRICVPLRYKLNPPA